MEVLFEKEHVVKVSLNLIENYNNTFYDEYYELVANKFPLDEIVPMDFIEFLDDNRIEIIKMGSNVVDVKSMIMNIINYFDKTFER